MIGRWQLRLAICERPDPGFLALFFSARDRQCRFANASMLHQAQQVPTQHERFLFLWQS